MNHLLLFVSFFCIQINSLLLVPIEMDIVFESGLYSAAWSISGKRFTDLSVIKQTNFDRRQAVENAYSSPHLQCILKR